MSLLPDGLFQLLVCSSEQREVMCLHFVLAVQGVVLYLFCVLVLARTVYRYCTGVQSSAECVMAEARVLLGLVCEIINQFLIRVSHILSLHCFGDSSEINNIFS